MDRFSNHKRLSITGIIIGIIWIAWSLAVFIYAAMIMFGKTKSDHTLSGNAGILVCELSVGGSNVVVSIRLIRGIWLNEQGAVELWLGLQMVVGCLVAFYFLFFIIYSLLTSEYVLTSTLLLGTPYLFIFYIAGIYFVYRLCGKMPPESIPTPKPRRYQPQYAF